jgi:hypothetical protein
LFLTCRADREKYLKNQTYLWPKAAGFLISGMNWLCEGEKTGERYCLCVELDDPPQRDKS